MALHRLEAFSRKKSASHKNSFINTFAGFCKQHIIQHFISIFHFIFWGETDCILFWNQVIHSDSLEKPRRRINHYLRTISRDIGTHALAGENIGQSSQIRCKWLAFFWNNSDLSTGQTWDSHVVQMWPYHSSKGRVQRKFTTRQMLSD